MDKEGFRNLFNQFNVIPKYLKAFNYAGLNLNETQKNFRNTF